MTTPNEPPWQVGRHEWRGTSFCQLCGLLCEKELDERGSPTGRILYRMIRGGAKDPVPTPCIPRLAGGWPGLLSSKEAQTRLGITKDAFLTRYQTRGLFPAAVGPNRTYYWRESDLARLVEHSTVARRYDA